jgi:hypothetical protein
MRRTQSSRRKKVNHNGTKSFQSEISETFVTFVRFVVKTSLLEWYISDEPLDAERIIEADEKSETSLMKSSNPAST